LRRIVLFSVVAAVVAGMVVAAPVMAQQAGIVEGPESKVEDGKASAKVSEDVWAKSDPCPEAQAGGAKAKAECPPPKPPPPKPAPPPPKAAPPPPPAPKALPPTGGVSSASLLALGTGALLVGGGLLARRFLR
jgi:periplasmic protein TonB